MASEAPSERSEENSCDSEGTPGAANSTHSSAKRCPLPGKELAALGMNSQATGRAFAGPGANSQRRCFCPAEGAITSHRPDGFSGSCECASQRRESSSRILGSDDGGLGVNFGCL